MSVNILLDTVGLIALWDKSDQWHEPAKAAYARNKLLKPKYFTTSYILMECGNASARRPYREAPDLLRLKMEQENRLIHPTATEWAAAWDDYKTGKAALAGIVDQFSFIVARRLQISRVFTNDLHFKAAGFETLF